jgi:ElaB/YqjD/DUF883 family membrane-anchored ribosome-binding protein
MERNVTDFSPRKVAKWRVSLFLWRIWMTKSGEGTPGDLAADLAALRKDIALLAETMSSLVQHQTEFAGHRVSEVAGDVKDGIASTAAGAQRRVCAAGGEIEAFIERNSLTAVLIALGVGISFGLLNRSRG